MSGIRYNNVVGVSFGNLTVIEELPRRYYSGMAKRMVMCKCVCGVILERYLPSLLMKKHDHNCGCKNRTHNVSHTPIHWVWQNMKKRCYNNKSSGYYRYGGRGITVCDEWANDFICFQKWALENGYAEGLQIDRINNEGNYSPFNCRFVTKTQNMNNRNHGVKVVVSGEKMSLSDGLRKMGLYDYYGKIYQRIRNGGLSFEYAIKI
jgi:hypothetical protein